MEDSKITVGHVSLHSCIRTHKIAWTWGDATKNKCVLFSERLQNNHHAWFAYDAAIKLYRDNKGVYHPWQLETAIRTLDPIIDVYHIHNEPDWPVWVIRKHSDKPIIYDIHDLASKRGPNEDEEKAIAVANGFSVVSRNYQEHIIRKTQTKPVREVLSCVPKNIMPKERTQPYRGGLVYEGGLGSKTTQEFPCRSWGEAFEQIAKLGIQVWAYTANPNVGPLPGAIVLGPMGYIRMIQELTMYEFGLVGSPFEDPMFDGALPNKLFEYMAAGLPMININAPDVERFLLATGMGVTVRDIKDIPDAMQYMRDRKYRRRVWENRWNWVMENQVHKVTWLYEKVLGRQLQKPIIPGQL